MAIVPSKRPKESPSLPAYHEEKREESGRTDREKRMEAVLKGLKSAKVGK